MTTGPAASRLAPLHFTSKMSQDIRYAALNSTFSEGESSIPSSAPQNFPPSLQSSSPQLASHTIDYPRSPSPLYYKPHISFTVRDAYTAKCDVHEGHVGCLYLECYVCGKHICQKCVPALNDGYHFIKLSEIDWNAITTSKYAGAKGTKKSTGPKKSKKGPRATGSTKVAKRLQKKPKESTKHQALFIRQQLSESHEENGLFDSQITANFEGGQTEYDISSIRLPSVDPALFGGPETRTEGLMDALHEPEKDGSVARKDKGKQREQILDWDSNNCYTSPPSVRALSNTLYVVDKTGEDLRRDHGSFDMEREQGFRASPDEWEAAHILVGMPQ